MAQRLRIVRTVPALRSAIARWRKRGERIALVPTMGALHAGHIALVRAARRRARRVVVSIFVNPAQFAPHEDFASYPRTFDTDIAALSGLKVDLIWAPPVAVMYPDGFATRISTSGATIRFVTTGSPTKCACSSAIFFHLDCAKTSKRLESTRPLPFRRSSPKRKLISCSTWLPQTRKSRVSLAGSIFAPLTCRNA